MKNAEITEPAEGTSTKDLLKNYLEDYCVNRIQKDDFEEIKMVVHIPEEGYHHFVFDNFFHNYLSEKTLEGAISKNITNVKDD